jgi:hypothetical protein
MTLKKSLIGATLAGNKEWKFINWTTSEKLVFRLQMRIAKAMRGEEVQQGKSLAKASYSLLFSKMYGGTKSYQQQGSKNSWN